MRKKKQKILYDKEENILSIELEAQKSVDSDVQGNAVFDYDKNGNIVRINLYDFSFDEFRSAKKFLQRFSRGSGISVLAR